MTKETIAGIFRHILTFAGGWAVGQGYIDDATAQTAIGALVTLVGAAWSVYQKRQAAAAQVG